MKFYELSKGQRFRFSGDSGIDPHWNLDAISAGVDGAYGRFVPVGKHWSEHEWWHYCRPLAEVEPLEGA